MDFRSEVEVVSRPLASLIILFYAKISSKIVFRLREL